MSWAQRVRAALALALLATTSWLLHTHGSMDGTLTIRLGSLDQLTRWAEETTPPTMAAATLRLVALGASVYGAAALAAALLADLVRCGGAVRIVFAASPRVLRRLVGGHAIHIGLAAGAVFGPTIRLAPAGAAPAAIIEDPEATRQEDDPPPAVATMVLLEPGDQFPPVSAPAPVPAPSPEPPAPEVWVVAPGDSFWSIAEASTDPTDVLRYWQDLITTNRDRLVAPDCPDLLIPGQTLELPPRLIP